MDIELIVLSYLSCDSSRYLFSLAFCAFSVLTRGLPALVASLAGAVDAGRSLRSPSGGDPRNEGIGGGGAYRELLKASEMVILF